MFCFADATGEALAGMLRPGNATANNAADQVDCLEAALDQLPAGCAEQIELLVRTDSAGQSHQLIDFCRERRIEFSVGYELTEPVRDAPTAIDKGAFWADCSVRVGSRMGCGDIRRRCACR